MKTINEITNHLKILIEEILLGAVTKDDIESDTALMDLGIDSLDFASIMLSGEAFVGGKINENIIDWRKVSTVHQLAEVLYNCQRHANEL